MTFNLVEIFRTMIEPEKGAKITNSKNSITSRTRAKIHAPGVWILVIFSIAAFLYVASEVMIPLILSLFLFFLLDPWVDALGLCRLPRAVTAPLLVFLSFSLFMGLGWAACKGIIATTGQFPKYSERMRGISRSLEDDSATLSKNLRSLFATNATPSSSQASDAKNATPQPITSGSSQDSSKDLASVLLRGAHSVFSFLAGLFFIPLLSIFFLLDRDYLKSHLKSSLYGRIEVNQLTRDVSAMVSGYFVGNFIVGVVASAIFLCIFSLLGLDHRFTLAFFAGFMNLIPLLGAVLGAVLPMSQAFLQFESVRPAFVILVSSCAIHLLVNNWVLPKIVGTRINVNPSAAAVGLLFGGWLWGGFGLLLAIPMTALIRIVLASSPQTRGLSRFFCAHKD